jgi:hypothetical protein
MKKIMMVKEKKCFVECIQMEDLDAIFFNSRFFLVIFIFFCVDFGKKFIMKFKSFHLDII